MPFEARSFREAVQLYSKAITLDAGIASFYTNRAAIMLDPGVASFYTNRAVLVYLKS
ncbi:hypothetical protein T484DRAFT_1815861 [Baffinella frigidus]|nr:hypothetical protein T484DRAFT_1815861 [Cryptophyta sp. CCMP2293]